MASINNWFALSLSSQLLNTDAIPLSHYHNPHSHISGGDSSAMAYAAAGGASGLVSDDCFNMSTTDGAKPSMHNPLVWRATDTFKANHNKSLLGGSDGIDDMNLEAPKLEDFLGSSSAAEDSTSEPVHLNTSHSFGNSEQELPRYDATAYRPYKQNSGNCMFPDCSLQIPATSTGNNAFGLSMMKSWLRNQPASAENKNSCGNNSSTNTAAAVAGNLPSVQALSLSMSTGSQSSSSAAVEAAGLAGFAETSSSEIKQKGLDSSTGVMEPVSTKSTDTFGQRTSIYRGVTRHRWTGRYEAHLWDNSCRREGQTRKGRQVYLGGYDKEEKAARAYDLAALKYWGTTTTTNFLVSNYEKELEEMKLMNRQEYVASLRRKSSGFSRGASIYRGVTRHHQHGRWQARIGRVAGNKDLYLGTFSTQEEAAEAYDIAAIKFRGLNAVTNFDMSRYDVKSILESATLPIGGAAKRLKEVDVTETSVDSRSLDSERSSSISDTISGCGHHYGWPIMAFQQPQAQSQQFFFQQRNLRKQERYSPFHSLQGLQQFHLTNAQNFLQTSVVHSFMSLDASSPHQGASSAVGYQGIMNGAGGLVLPLNPTMVDHNQVSFRGGEMKKLGASSYDSTLSGDPHSGRNLYYHSQ